MGAFVRHEFKRGFLLDEERIRKINEILNQRLMEVEGCPKATFKVYRADAFSYTTPDVQVVIDEENSEWQQITRLTVSASSGDILDLTLDFDESGTKLDIEGEDRDFVYLLFSDLRQYLSNEVNVLAGLPPKTGRLVTSIGLTFMLVAMLVWMWSLPRSLFAPPPTTVLESQDVREKLNFLIERRTAPTGASFLYGPTVIMGIGLFSVLALLLGEETLSKMARFLFPTNVFLFGKERERYASRLALRTKIFWGVIVALVVSVAAGLVVWLITNR